MTTGRYRYTRRGGGAASRFAVFAGIVFAFAVVACTRMPTEVTFYKDVLPILQKNCQECHRPGEVAPTSFLTYEEVRPQAKAMKEAVLGRRMPPWFADPAVGRFTNDRSLSRTEMETIANWVDSGTHAGEPKDAPAPRQFADGWLAGKPDVVFEMPADYEVPASGVMRYVYGIVPTNFREDRWVQMAEARPGNRTVVHHIIVYVRDSTSTWLREYPMGRVFTVRDHGKNSPIDEVLTAFVPGAQPLVLRPGQARLIKAGSDLVFEIHYTANGKSASDRSRVGIVFAKEPPRQRVVMLNVANYKFVIPPGAPAHRVDETITLQGEAELVSLHAHMHLRGKSMEIRAVYPSGDMEKLLWVPNYDFKWQLWYYLPPGKALPRGTRIEVVGTFDNSSKNKNNPDPTVAVRSGEQSWDEMMMGFIEVAIDAGMNPTDLLRSSSSFHAGGQS